MSNDSQSRRKRTSAFVVVALLTIGTLSYIDLKLYAAIAMAASIFYLALFSITDRLDDLNEKLDKMAERYFKHSDDQ